MNITRFHNMEKLDVSVEFLTPTFLGGADQNAELRSAPFKNLIRQWWRVVNGNLDVSELRKQEGELFGTVLGDNDATASKVRMFVTFVDEELKAVSNQFNFGRTPHPEVRGGMAVENSLYLGYGPVTFKQGVMHFKSYIIPGSKAMLSISFPRQFREQIISIMQLMDAFGTIGSRCRNGYGSLALSADGVARLNPATLQTRMLAELVGNDQKEYPNRFGSDNHGLFLWESNVQPQWTNAMTLLAGTYLRTRTNIPIAGEGAQRRHALGYPVTHHSVGAWGGGNGRMPSQLRLMVKRNLNNELVARILHLPHKLPKQWPNTLPTQQHVWQQVHQFLDGENQFHRIGGAV